MQYDVDGNVINNEVIETDRKFWSVPVSINSTVWESGYHIYEANSAEEALEMYHSDKELPHEIEYTGWIDQEYRYDEIDCDDGSEIEEIPTVHSDVQNILILEKSRKKWLEEQAEKERRSKLI
jgi:hypothetical protein